MMKNLHFFLKCTMLLACVSILCISNVQAQTEIIVQPGLNTLSDALSANPGATLILQRDGDYAVTGSLVINVPTIIKGETEPAEDRPAVISYSALPGGAKGKNLFKIGASCTFQNFGVIGFTDDGQQINGVFETTAPDLSLTIDGCIIQGPNRVILTNQDGLTIVQKNNVLFNVSTLGFDNFGGMGCLWGNNNGDFKSYNNTFFACGRIFNFGGGGPDGAEAMEHNSYVNCWGDTYYPSYNKTFNCKNNIFFNTQLRGYVGLLKDANGDTLYKGDFTDWAAKEIPVTDVLAGDVGIFINPADTLADGTPNPVHRTVNVTNNLKMYDQRVLDFYAANKITKQPFMPATDYVFAAKYGWNIKDNLLEENGTAIDPKFEMGVIPESAFEMAFKARLNRHLPTELAEPGYPFNIAWRPGGEERGEFIWPLPFKLKPTNSTLWHAGDDGYPLGDLNWFAPEVKAAWEAKQANPITSLKSINESNKSAYISNDILRFKGFDKAVNAEVFSTLGQKILVAKNINELNVSKLKHGIYLIRVNNCQTFRVVK